MRDSYLRDGEYIMGGRFAGLGWIFTQHLLAARHAAYIGLFLFMILLPRNLENWYGKVVIKTRQFNTLIRLLAYLFDCPKQPAMHKVPLLQACV